MLVVGVGVDLVVGCWLLVSVLDWFGLLVVGSGFDLVLVLVVGC